MMLKKFPEDKDVWAVAKKSEDAPDLANIYQGLLMNKVVEAFIIEVSKKILFSTVDIADFDCYQYLNGKNSSLSIENINIESESDFNEAVERFNATRFDKEGFLIEGKGVNYYNYDF